MISLYIIDLPYANFGIEVENDKVTRTAPIGGWMFGRDISFISQWVHKRGGTIEKF